MIYALFAFGGFWFWALCLLEFILLISWVENEIVWPANLSVIVCILLFTFFGDINVFKAIFMNPVKSTVYCFSYIVLGFIWSPLKYKLMLSRKNREYEREKAIWLGEHPDKTEDDFIKRKEYRYMHKYSFENCWDKLIFWAAYWPFSLFWTLLRDAFIRIFEEIAYKLRGLYEQIYKRTFGNILKDIERSKELERQENAAENE